MIYKAPKSEWTESSTSTSVSISFSLPIVNCKLKLLLTSKLYQTITKHALRADDADCSVSWTAYTDTDRNGGRSTGSSTVGECLNDCYWNTSCTAIDWNPTASAGRQCWLHGPWSTGPRNERTGVHHFVITRPVSCGTHIGVSFHRGRHVIVLAVSRDPV